MQEFREQRNIRYPEQQLRVIISWRIFARSCVFRLRSSEWTKRHSLYVGVTSDLVRRVQEHREGLVPGFTRKHAVKLLVYWELHHDIAEAILREKRIKRWHRKWKLELIEATIRSGATCGRS